MRGGGHTSERRGDRGGEISERGGHIYEQGGEGGTSVSGEGHIGEHRVQNQPHQVQPE